MRFLSNLERMHCGALLYSALELVIFVFLTRDADNYMSHAAGELRRVIIVSIW